MHARGSLPAIAAAFLSLAVTASLSCSAPRSPAPVDFVASSSTIVLDAGEGSVWLTSPDDDAVFQISTRDFSVLRRIPLDGGPEQIVRAGTWVVVTLRHAAEIAAIDLLSWTEGSPWQRIAVPCGGTRAVVAAGPRISPSPPQTVLVSCPNDDLIVLVNVTVGTVTRTIAAPGRPTALAIAGDQLAVTASRTGHLRIYSRQAIFRTPSASPPNDIQSPLPLDRVLTAEIALSPGAGFAATQVDALAPAGTTGRFVATYQLVDADSDRTRPPERGGYGSVLDGTPRIEPRIFSACGGRYARFDGGPRVMSGPSALAYAAPTGLLVVTNRYTDNVAVLACDVPSLGTSAPLALEREHVTRGELSRVVGSYRVGRAPRGVVLAKDGRTAFVDVGFDHAVARIDLPARAAPEVASVSEAAAVARRPLGTTRLSAAALTGRSLFNDAVNTHLTPSGVVTCATCHPGGGEDGLRWFIQTRNVRRKVRRTPPAWAGKAALAPFHWDGEFHDIATLARGGIRELMDGDGLLVDTTMISAYLEELPPPPARPLSTAERTAAEEGRALFGSAAVGCATCHAGPAFTDRRFRSVVTESTDPDARMTQVDTPTLLGIRVRPPYLHDGRAETLRSLLTTHNPGNTHGRTSHLTAGEIDSLVLHLETL